jgi:hypothetical protein
VPRALVLLLSLALLACTKPTPADTPADIPAQPTQPAPVIDTTGWVAFEDGDRYGYKDAAGKVVLPPRYQMAQDFTPRGLACVVEADEWRCIDPRGNELLRPYIYDNGPDYFAEGLARFVEAGKLGFFDDSGARVIPARFEFVTPFAEERAAFCVGCKKECTSDGEHCGMTGGKWGLIDRTGAELLAPRFDEIGPFEGGTASAKEGGLARLIDRTGAIVGTANAPAR